MLATATSSPNWIISTSFWNCGAPPLIEIALAIVRALIAAAAVVPAKAANQARRSGSGTGPPSR